MPILIDGSDHLRRLVHGTMSMQICNLSVGLLFLQMANAYKFLGLFPTPIRSHFIFFESLVTGLIEKGHEVDVLSHFPRQKPIARYTDISVQGSLPVLDNVTVEAAASMDAWQTANFVYEMGQSICQSVIQHPNTAKLKSNKIKYDAIITEVYATDCLLGFADIFKVPLIGVTSTTTLPWADDRMGNPDNPSYIANYFTPHKGSATLIRKFEVAFAAVMTNVGYHLLSTIPSEMRARDFFGKTLTPLDRLALNTSVMLINGHFSLNSARPTVPGLAEVGGLHIPKNLPQPNSNVLEIIHNAANGVIYFSFGTVIRCSTMPEEKTRAILRAFSKFPLITFIWKCDRSPTGLPKNVRVVNWTSQIGILCHPKTKIFISHGGQMGIQEAAYCGVPILGVPFFSDQKLNVETYVEYGAGMKIEYAELNELNMTRSLTQLLNNPAYVDNAGKLSRIFKDRPIGPLENAVYWTEYAVRHGGAKQIRTKAREMIWFDYFLVDVIVVCLVLFALLIAFFAYSLNIVQNYFDGHIDRAHNTKGDENISTTGNQRRTG